MKPRQRVHHRCLCGYAAPNYSQYRYHQSICQEWRDRPNPRGMSIWRRQQAQVKEVVGVPTVEELTDIERFRQVLERHDIDPRAFAKFLSALERRRFSR